MDLLQEIKALRQEVAVLRDEAAADARRSQSMLLVMLEAQRKAAASGAALGLMGAAGPEAIDPIGLATVSKKLAAHGLNPDAVFTQLRADLDALKPRSWWQRCLQWFRPTGAAHSAREKEAARRSLAQRAQAFRAEGSQ